jgi:hypothetical protein
VSEKAHVYGVALFEVILGVLQMIIAATTFSLYTFWLMMISEISRTQYSYYPDYYVGMLGAAGSIILFLGIYVLIHAVRRIVDHGLAAYVASKKPVVGFASSYPVRHCIHCGAEIPEGATFCTKCGKKQT